MTGQGPWLGLVGGLFLIYLGTRTFMAAPAESAMAATPGAWEAAPCALLTGYRGS